MFNLLLVTSGIFWTATYLLIIRQGFRERTYGMPLAALGANLSWEFIFSVLHPHGFPQVLVNAIWLAFDLVIAWQVVKFGPAEWRWPRGPFYILIMLVMVTAFPVILLVSYEFSELDKMSGAYAAFGQNLMMSLLFLNFLRERGTRGQTVSIAVCKMLGTAFAALGFLLYTSLGQSPLMLLLFGMIAVIDLVYIGFLAGWLVLPQLTTLACPACGTLPKRNESD